MRTNLIIALSLLISVSRAQPVITNQSLTDPSLNIAYIGVDNEILISGADTAKRTSMAVMNGKLFKKDANNYILQPAMGDSCFLYLYRGDSLLTIKRMKSLSLPEPAAKLANITGRFATVQEILDNPVVSIQLPGAYYKHTYVPLRYYFRIENDAKEYKYIKVNYTARLNEDQKELVKYCTPGTVIIVDGVYATDKSRKKYTAAAAVYVIK